MGGMPRGFGVDTQMVFVVYMIMQKKILIVDDSAVARRMLKSCIPRAEDYTFHEADDGVQGLEIFKKEHPDITFMDINMPNMNGIECLEGIRKIDPGAVVVVCSSETDEALKKSQSVGAVMVIKKPATRESVQEALAKV